MNKYIKNMETGKIELHFDKSEYEALSEAQKSELKSTFLFSGRSKAWVSRAKEPNTYRAVRVAEKLGFPECEKVGERLSYAEQLDRKTERAEERADRYEEHAANAVQRSKALQQPLESMRGDIAFFTQPIIAGHAGSQAFARCRQRMYDKYDRGMAEYRKSEYYQDRAETARTTAAMPQLSNRIYLDNRIKECNKKLRDLQKCIVGIEENIYKLEQGEQLKTWKGEYATIEGQEERLEDILGRYEAEQDKLNFMEDCMNKLGGVQFSKENIKPGYIVEMTRWGKCEILSVGPVNVQYKILEGGAAGLGGAEAYAAIKSIISETAAAPIVNPYVVGDILCRYSMSGNSLVSAFQVVKVADKSVQIQQINVEQGKPQPGQFVPDSKPSLKKIIKSKYSNFVGVYAGNWQLQKYVEK